MKRLTEKHWRNLDPWECCGQDDYCKRGCHEKGGCAKGCIVPRLYDRLAAYEDTGLTPEEVMTLIASPNTPLTLEELREMDGEPVWVCAPDGSSGRYGLVCVDPFWGVENSCVTTHSKTAYSRTLYFVTYGKAWLAYRRKPEEG